MMKFGMIVLVSVVLGWQGASAVEDELSSSEALDGFVENAMDEDRLAEVTEAVDAAPVFEPVIKPDGGTWLPPAIIAFGDVDEALVVRAQAWAEENLAISVPLLPAVPTAQLESFDDVVALASTMIETNRIGYIVIWRPASDISNHGAHFPEQKVVIANLNPMLTPDTEAETIERRIERQVVRGVCLLIGLEPSPNPYSAMYAYSNLEELDAIGRNLDPPWLKRLQETALRFGLTLDQESSFNMVQ